MGDSSYVFDRINDGMLVIRDSAAERLNTGVEYRDLIIPWQFSIDGGVSFVSLGTSTNQLYSLLQSPVGGQAVPIRHTSVHVSTVAALDRNTEDGVLVGVWAEFADNTVRKAPVRVGAPQGAVMRYVHGSVSTDDFDQFFGNTFGTCQAWSRFLADSLRIHGIQAKVLMILTNDGVDARPAPSDPADEYLPPQQQNDFRRIRVGDGPAQGSGGADYTETEFNFHAVTFVEREPGRIYDPSYGRVYEGEDLLGALSVWENANLVSTQHLFRSVGGVEYTVWQPKREGIRDVKYKIVG